MRINLIGKRQIALETQTQTPTKKRGGARTSGAHLALLIGSTLLLTLAGVFLIMSYNLLGIVTMLAGIALRYVDTRI